MFQVKLGGNKHAIYAQYKFRVKLNHRTNEFEISLTLNLRSYSFIRRYWPIIQYWS